MHFLIFDILTSELFTSLMTVLATVYLALCLGVALPAMKSSRALEIIGLWPPTAALIAL